MSEIETKTKIVVFCPDCLKKMSNGSNPKIYFHSTVNRECPLNAVRLNEKGEIAQLVYSDGAERIVIKP